MIVTTYGEGGYCEDCDPDAHGHPLHNVVETAEIPDPEPDPSPVADIAAALAALPPATLDALRDALGLGAP